MHRQPWIPLAVFVFLIALGVEGRILSKAVEAPNFTPLAACALFAGFFFSQMAVAAIVPLAIMTLTNVWLYQGRPFQGYDRWEMMLVVYGALLVPLLFRPLLRKRLSVPRVAFGAIGSALLFYGVTNFAHWCVQDRLPHNAEGLLQVYIDGLPFLRGTLIGDLMFSALLFGGYALTMRYIQPAEDAATVPVRKQP